MSINTIRTCNIELDATVFGSAQNEPNFPPISPMSLSALRFWPRRSSDETQGAKVISTNRAAKNKYRRFTMGKARQLQCNALGAREKNPWRKNNEYQWKNNANNNGNNEKYSRLWAACDVARRAGFACRIYG